MNLATLLQIIRDAAASGDPAPYVEARAAFLANPPPEEKPFTELFADCTPAEGLRRLGEWLDTQQASGVAISTLNLAVSLEPKGVDHRKTRGLVLMSLLRADEARADFDKARRDEHGKLLGTYVELCFPEVTFPSLVIPTDRGPVGEGHAEVQQPLEAIADQIRVYVGRLEGHRAALRAKGGPPKAAWLPPVLSSVAPAVDVEELSALDQLTKLREAWTALTTLCWAIGMDRVAIPTSLDPVDVGNALEWAEFMLWRARDQQLSGGAAANAQGLPDFRFRGIDVRNLPQPLAPLVSGEVAEAKAVLRWLTDATVLSPDEDGLRDS